jgi:hypothetical protein
MWKPGPALTLTGSTQVLTTEIGLAKAVKFMQHPNNTQVIYYGDSTLDVATNTGITGIVAAPTADNSAPKDEIYENDAPNGINCGLLYVSGTADQVLLWAYLEQ